MNSSSIAKRVRVCSVRLAGVAGILCLSLFVISGQGLVEAPRAMAQEAPKGDAYWARKIRNGGYILFFRHAEREKWSDVTAFDAVELLEKLDGRKESFVRATCLTDKGIEEAKIIGRVMQHAGVKVSSVISSPSCRARETAIHAFGKIDQISNSILHASAIDPLQHKDMAARLREILLNAEIKSGANLIISGHGATMEVYKDKVIDENNADKIERLETGFVVLERVNGKLVAQHTFQGIYSFARHVYQFPVN